MYRAVARSEILGGLVVLGGDNESPLVKIGLTDLPNIGGAKAPPAPTLRRPCSVYVLSYYIAALAFVRHCNYDTHFKKMSLDVTFCFIKKII